MTWTRGLVASTTVYVSVGLPIGVVEGYWFRQAGGSWRGTVGWGALATVAGPVILAQTTWDWFRAW